MSHPSYNPVYGHPMDGRFNFFLIIIRSPSDMFRPCLFIADRAHSFGSDLCLYALRSASILLNRTSLPAYLL